jgi:hypothetical protein
MKPDLRFNLGEIKRALKRLQPHVKKSRSELTEQAARGFVKEVVEISPPGGGGRRGNVAKKTGEAAIKSDLARVMTGVRARKNVATQDPREIHQRFRDLRTGRINPRNQTPSLPDAAPRSHRSRCAGRESNFLAVGVRRSHSSSRESRINPGGCYTVPNGKRCKW